MNRTHSANSATSTIDRRRWLRQTVGFAAMLAGSRLITPKAESGEIRAADGKRAQIAITLDLEMSAQYPTKDQVHWNYEKGNLNEETKRYAVEAARRVKQAGGTLHFFVVGRVFEQENTDWLREIVQTGHPVGNHTYDHVNVKGKTPEDLQFRFRRAPWLVEGRTPHDIVVENIRLTTEAMKNRIGVSPTGFRTPGGFNNGLHDVPEIQQLLLDQGYRWVSSLYPAHQADISNAANWNDVLQDIVAKQQNSQPFVYPSGLIEIPMSPVSDVTAFRAHQWKLEQFLEAIRAAVSWTIDHGAMFDFLAHPSCLYVTDPEFRAIDLICDLVQNSAGQAEFADLERIAERTTESLPN
ncbi:MAG: polysaccharide deacetylase family protein [Planctomycetaceae bacterium]